jgi:large subunit ribosomal protein L10
MATAQKEAMVAELEEKFKDASALYLANFEGMDMAKTTELRKSFAEHNVEYKVVKNTLAKIALNNVGISDLDEFFAGTTAIALASDDPTKPAKVISEFNKENESQALALKACLFEGRLFGPDKVDQLAKLPSREDLIAKFAATLNAPMTKFVQTIAAPLQNTLGVLTALKDKK